jgi:hypothetical protein
MVIRKIIATMYVLVSVIVCAQKPVKDAKPAAGQHDPGKVWWCNPDTFGSLSTGEDQYYCAPDPTGPKGKKGRVEIDVKAETIIRNEQARKDDLARDMTSCVLSTEQLAEALRQWDTLFTSYWQPYLPEDMRQKFKAALDVQKTLRDMKMPACKALPGGLKQ